MISKPHCRLSLQAWTFLLLAGCAGEHYPQPQQPVIVQGVSIGMTQNALVAARPAAFDDSGVLSEQLGPGEKAIYWFGRNFDQEQVPKDRLAVVVRSARPTGPELANLMNTIRKVEQRWSSRLGDPDTVPVRELARGQGAMVRLHARIWSTSGQYVLLTFERAAASPSLDQWVAYNVIVQDKRLDPEFSLPDR